VSLVKYLRSAFTNQWNMLAFLGSLGFAALSGAGDVAVPLVMAAEVAYLGLLGTHSKFQSYVDAQAAKRARDESSAAADQALKQILAALPRESVARFKQLRDRCLELRQLSTQLTAADREPIGNFDRLRAAGLDRLLWIYLRLLYTEFSLGQFLRRTDHHAIEAEMAETQQRLAPLANAAADSREERIRKSLEDNLKTCRDRLANYQTARDNFELVRLEIDRLENKIQALSELAINRQEPDLVSGQVDEVAGSMLNAERTMNDLRFATGLRASDDAVPQLLDRPTAKVRA
jgi:chemotaxis protein histidine kinase CheA